MSQREQILKALEAGDRLTWLVALNRFSCGTLAQRCSELRRAGHNIKSRMVETPQTKKKVAEYFIPREEPQCPHP